MNALNLNALNVNAQENDLHAGDTFNASEEKKASAAKNDSVNSQQSSQTGHHLRVVAGSCESSNANSANGEIVFHSAKMQSLIENAMRFATSSASVMICGESGTGKELFARLVHANSDRSEKRFVQVNCAALSENLLESEFFGHMKGAYTGADEPRLGRFEWADGGTILLDEVTEIPVRLQAKLLRVLEENVFQRVGCNLDRKIDVRVIATSNRNLEEAVSAGDFRNDLFHRLNILQLQIPPLRDRVEDIPLLAERFVQMFRHESSVGVRGISESAMEKLAMYSWSGNVRQLRNLIHRACVLAKSEWIDASDLELPAQQQERIPDWILESRLDEVERHLILANLNRFSGNKTQAAKHLGITARTLHTKLNTYREQGLVE